MKSRKDEITQGLGIERERADSPRCLPRLRNGKWEEEGSGPTAGWAARRAADGHAGWPAVAGAGERPQGEGFRDAVWAV